MSNYLIIAVTEFKHPEHSVLNVYPSQFGFRASDSYAKIFEDDFDTLEAFYEAFYEAYPTKEALISSIVSRDEFAGLEYDAEKNELREDVMGDLVSFEVEGYKE